jgi:ribosome biogenesis GTPase
MSQFVCRYKMRDMGVQQAEPRFEPKKHRRKSHKIINQSILDELEEDDDDLEVEK